MRLKIFTSITVLLIAVSCSKPPIEGSTKVLVPWPTGTGAYELRVVEVNTLKDSTAVSGDAARIFMEPKLTADGLRGDAPVARFMKTNEGVLIPTDYMTSQLAGLYAHAEKLWDLDRALGIDGLVKYPRKYGIKAKVFKNGEEEQVKNNATYVEMGDSTLIMPYEGNPEAPDKQLPIPLNAGILAHEHFHALFDSTMGKMIGSPEDTEGLNFGCEAFDTIDSDAPAPAPRAVSNKIPKVKMHNYLVMRGINEGLADFWGWVYTGDDNFMVHSLPLLAKGRSLESKTAEEFIKTEDFLEISDQLPKHTKAALSYRLGTQIARTLRRMGAKMLANDGIKENSDMSSLEDRMALAKTVMASLPKLKQAVEAKIKEDKVIETTVFNDVIFLNETKKKFEKTDCLDIQKTLSVVDALAFKEKNCLP